MSTMASARLATISLLGCGFDPLHLSVGPYKVQAHVSVISRTDVQLSTVY